MTAILCGDCGWRGSESTWRRRCRGFPCELKLATDAAKTGTNELVAHLRMHVAAECHDAAALIEQQADTILSLRGALQVARNVFHDRMMERELYPEELAALNAIDAALAPTQTGGSSNE